MTPEKFLEIIGEIDDEFIEEASPENKINTVIIVKNRFRSAAGIAAGIAAGVLAITVVTNSMIMYYKKTHWVSGGPLSASTSVPTASSDEAEALYEENGVDTDDDADVSNDIAYNGINGNTDSDAGPAAGSAPPDFKRSAKQGFTSGSSAADSISADEAVKNEEAVPEENISVNSYEFDGGAVLFYSSCPDETLASACELIENKASDTHLYSYSLINYDQGIKTENSEKILSALLQKTQNADSGLYYFAQYYNNELSGYACIDENGNITEDMLK